jgi:hypothetical protein
MDWLIFWGVIIAYWAVGIKRMPTYYQRTKEHHKKEYPATYAADNASADRTAAWGSLGLASIWPYYEAGRWLRDHIIHTMTADERRQQEYQQAERIVAEYTARKEREEREEFDQKLRGL